MTHATEIADMTTEQLALTIRLIESSPSAQRSFTLQQRVADHLDALRAELATR